MESWLLPCGAPGVSLLTVWCLPVPRLRGALDSAVPLPPGRNGLGARRGVLSTFRALSLGRLVAPRIHAQRIAQSDPYDSRNRLPTQK